MSDYKDYVKMCNCPEIQDGWKPKIGDWTWNVHFKQKVLINKPFILEDIKSGRFIYLPTIEQLMGMIGQTIADRVCKCYDFFVHKDGDEFETERELWLAFVMSELHNKKWDGKKWIKIT